MRFVLIFLLISAATAALLWYFWPREAEKAAEEKTETVSVSENSGKDEAPQGGEEKKTAPGEKSAGASEVEKKEAPQELSGSSEDKKISQNLPDPTDPPLPDKGKITPADMQGKDLPVVPAGTIVSDEQNALLEKAASALSKKEFSAAEKAAVQALAGVVEDSDFFRKAWRLLTAARTGIVYSGTGGEHVVRYRIRSGDSLSGIAGRFFTTSEFLRKRNKISGSRIFVGRSLYIVPGFQRKPVG